jgi:2-oxoglutarate dehydrogenase complex dehydrogenase (E1) component-like enzyme
MELPDNVLEKVYNKNAEKIFAQFKGVNQLGAAKP